MLNTIFLWLRPRKFPEHPAEHGIVYDVIMAAPPSQEDEIKGRFPPADFGEREAEGSRKTRSGNCYFSTWTRGKWRFRVGSVKPIGLIKCCATKVLV